VPLLTHRPVLPDVSTPLNRNSPLKTDRSLGRSEVEAPVMPVSSEVPGAVPSVTHRPSWLPVLRALNNAKFAFIDHSSHVQHRIFGLCRARESRVALAAAAPAGLGPRPCSC